MLLHDLDAQARLLGLGCFVRGNQVVCDGVALDYDVSGMTLDVLLGDDRLTVVAGQVPTTDGLYNRYVEGMEFEIKSI